MQEYEKEKLNERIARLSGGVAIIQVGGSGTWGGMAPAGACMCSQARTGRFWGGAGVLAGRGADLGLVVGVDRDLGGPGG